MLSTNILACLQMQKKTEKKQLPFLEMAVYQRHSGRTRVLMVHAFMVFQCLCQCLWFTEFDVCFHLCTFPYADRPEYPAEENILEDFEEEEPDLLHLSGTENLEEDQLQVHFKLISKGNNFS